EDIIHTVKGHATAFDLLVQALGGGAPGDIGDGPHLEIGGAGRPVEHFTDQPELAAGEGQQVVEQHFEGCVLIVAGQEHVLGTIDGPVEMGNINVCLVRRPVIGALDLVFHQA